MLNLNYNGMAFSSNGQYMVIDAPGKALLRVNMGSGVVTPFASSFTYGSSYSSVAQMAISDDGTMVGISGQGGLRIYDLSTCGSVPSTITGPVTCDMKNLSSFWSAGTALNQIGFVDDDTLYAYLHVVSPSSFTKYMLTSYGHTMTTQQYLALGDSYSSGEGAYNYELGTDTSNNKCHLSTLSYPYLIASAQSYSAFHSVACSGATSADVVNRAQHPTVPTPNSLGSWMPGVTDQLQKVELSNPDVITLGIGGNDIGFQQMIEKCVSPFTIDPTCYDSYDARLGIIDGINNEYAKLVNDYKQVKSVAKSTAKIYAIGYPQIADPSGTSCKANVHLDGEEINLSNQLITHLNYTIQQAATSAGIQYVDVSGALSGHELCDAATSNMAINGLTAGQENLHIIGSESYHPDKLGQQYLKSAIMSATGNFGTYTPGTPSSAVAPTRTSTTAQALLGPYATADSNTISVPIPDQDVPDTAYKSSGLSFMLNHDTSTLAPNTSYTVTIHSTPTSLGTFTTDATGNLSVSASIPGSVANGVHTVDITGTNVAGQPVDVYQTVAIGQTQGDFDGDGNTDSASSCGLNTGTSTDVDGDGVDDACEAVVGRSATDVSNLYRARQGNPVNGESANKIYIERNVALASSMLGVSDYDADSDGWSLIGVAGTGQEAAYASIKVGDTGPTDNTYDEYIPVVSGRTDSNGCVQLAPASLAPVTSSSAVTVTTVATNTNTCRTASPSSDVDGDSTPDNLDTLYRVRVGDPALGESSSDTYLERNMNASEAALGISDYDDNGDGWAKVATFSSAYTYSTIGLLDPTSNTIIANGAAAFTTTLLGNYTQLQRQGIVPVVATGDGTNCYNYEPNNLGFVATGQARTAALLGTNVLSCFP